MFQKQRRSSSSLSGRNMHSVSASIQQPHKEEYQQVYNIFYGIKRCLKNHYKQKQMHFQQVAVRQLYQQASTGLKKYHKIQLYHENQSKQLELLKQKYQCEKRNIIQLHEHTLKQMESEHTQAIISLTNEKQRKDCEYRDLISNFINSTTHAKNAWKNTYQTIQQKCLNLIRILQSCKQNIDQNKFLNQGIIDLVSELNLRKQQDSFCSKKSLQLSSCFIQGPSPQNRKYQNPNSKIYTNHNDEGELNLGNQCRRNNLDYSSIQIRDQNQFEDGLGQQKNEQFEKDIDYCLRTMIFCGLFTEENRKKINKMIDISNSLPQYYQLVNHAVYPLILEVLNLKWDEFQKQLQDKDMTLEQISQSQSNIMIDQSAQLRNIERIQDLSFRENIPPQKDTHFKKKKK